jgi:uncharacterized protein YlxW (UPF0749 family)
MTLLVDISSQALDPGYARAAARRQLAAQSQPATHGRPRNRGVTLAVGLTLAAVLVVIAGVQARQTAPESAKSRASLLAAVRRASTAVAGLERQIAVLSSQTARLRDARLASSSAGAALISHLDAEELAAGSLPVTGPGLRVTLDDAPPSTSSDRNRVLDRDLQSVVNALWAAGAEAIAIDGERLTAQSSIRQAGAAILVDFQPVSAPYFVAAIGDPVGLATGFGASPAAGRMRSYSQLYGLRFGYARVSKLGLPAAAESAVRLASPLPAPRRSDGRHS